MADPQTGGRSVARRRELVAQFAEPLRAFLRTETGGAGLLLLATLGALIWANSRWGTPTPSSGAPTSGSRSAASSCARTFTSGSTTA